MGLDPMALLLRLMRLLLGRGKLMSVLSRSCPSVSGAFTILDCHMIFTVNKDLSRALFIQELWCHSKC